jgi:hypothetical protein
MAKKNRIKQDLQEEWGNWDDFDAEGEPRSCKFRVE